MCLWLALMPLAQPPVAAAVTDHHGNVGMMLPASSSTSSIIDHSAGVVAVSSVAATTAIEMYHLPATGATLQCQSPTLSFLYCLVSALSSSLSSSLFWCVGFMMSVIGKLKWKLANESQQVLNAGLLPLNARCSKLLLFEGSSIILV